MADLDRLKQVDREVRRRAARLSQTSADMLAQAQQIDILKAQLASAIQLAKDQQAAMTALQGRLTVEEQATANDATRLIAIEANYLKRFMLPDWNVVIAQGLALALAAGNRTYTLTLAASFGVKAGAPIFATPKGAVPAGYLVGAASAPADNTLNIQIGNPLIAIGGSMSLLLSVFTLRP